MNMKTRLFLPVFLLIMWMLPGARPASAKEEIIVSAAASLTNAMTKAGQRFMENSPEIKVIFNFASSGSLLQQMVHGAPVDVFASANQKFMNAAEKKNLILPGTRKNFVRNKLVLAAPKDSNLNIKKMSDLSLSAVRRISLGNPETVPAGIYAQESLKNHGLWEKLAHKFIYGSSVRQVADYISRGEVDVGLLYSTDTKILGDKVKVIMEVGKHKSVIYPIAVLSSSRKKELANRFLDFVLSDKGQEVFAEFGFSKP